MIQILLKNLKAVLEKWVFEYFRGPFYDDIIHRDKLYLWPNEELKNNTKHLRLTLVTFEKLPSDSVGVNLKLIPKCLKIWQIRVLEVSSLTRGLINTEIWLYRKLLQCRR